MPKGPEWLDKPQKHDFAAAEHFLSLVLHEDDVETAIAALKKRRGKLRKFAAKDILRASELETLPADNQGVAAKLDHINKGTPISPVLLVRPRRGPLIVADGYHRVSAARLLDEAAEVPCDIVSID